MYKAIEFREFEIGQFLFFFFKKHLFYILGGPRIENSNNKDLKELRFTFLKIFMSK